MTNYSRSVLKSNGLRHSKNPPCKVRLFAKTVPATIAKKLPPQRCSKPFLHPDFQLRTNGPRLLSPRKRVHTRLSEKDRTQGLTRRNRGVSDGGVLLPSDRFTRFGNPAWPGVERQTLPLLGLGWMYSRRMQRAFGTAMRLCVSLSQRLTPLGLRDPW